MQYHIFVLWVQSVGNLFVSILPPASSYLVTVGTGLVATPLSESPMTIVFKTNSKKKLWNSLMSTLFQRQNKFKVDTNSLSPSTFKSLCIVLFGYLSSVVETLFKTRIFLLCVEFKCCLLNASLECSCKSSNSCRFLKN